MDDLKGGVKLCVTNVKQRFQLKRFSSLFDDMYTPLFVFFVAKECHHNLISVCSSVRFVSIHPSINKRK